MSTIPSDSADGGLLASLLAEDIFRPHEPQSIEETGISPVLIESMICTLLLQVGSCSGRSIADQLAIPFGILEGLVQSLRNRQLLVHTGHAQLNDYNYALTEDGNQKARAARDACAYVGPIPVPLEDYILSVEAQTVRAEAPRQAELQQAFEDISVEPDLFAALGPAVNSGAGLFLYGAPGNGKTTLARRITRCFGQDIWIPRAIIEDGQIIKLFDASFHEPVDSQEASVLKAADFDRRWVKVRRPTVVVGGELTMDNLEIRHDAVSNVSEASLQMKSNCGCLLIDDFGRQRIEPTELLNRWIVPLESRHDFLTIATGKKIQVPFEQLIIFSTNLEPSDLADDAFLRRLPYKIEIGDPDPSEFHRLFEAFSKSFGCECDPQVVDYLIETHYKPHGRPLRRCQPRDLLSQVRNYCVYNDIPMEMRKEYFDLVVKSYFTVLRGD